jgi:hypothetical protein
MSRALEEIGRKYFLRLGRCDIGGLARILLRPYRVHVDDKSSIRTQITQRRMVDKLGNSVSRSWTIETAWTRVNAAHIPTDC